MNHADNTYIPKYFIYLKTSYLGIYKYIIKMMIMIDHNPNNLQPTVPLEPNSPSTAAAISASRFQINDNHGADHKDHYDDYGADRKDQ